MNFFQHQAHAKRKTGYLILLLIVAVASVILAVEAAIEFIIMWMREEFETSLTLETHIIIALVVFIFIGSGTIYKLMQLRDGGEVIARLLGGRRVSPHTTDVGEKRALNVVEEMAIASGIPVPLLYVLPDDDSINAFAAGFSIHDAVVGITKGAIDKLSREELQGVIAHEFSHILHGDMQLNLKLIGILHGILLVGLTGQMIMRILSETRSSSRGGKKDPRAPIFLFGLALFVIGFVGFFFGRLIKAAVSRQREFLADASAVQYTRNASGLGGALKKIGSSVSTLKSSRAEEVSHMLFAEGSSSWLASLLATHPPTMERIKRIEGPLFDGSGLTEEKTDTDITYSEAVSSKVGEITPSTLSFAASAINNMATSLQQAHASRAGASALVYSLISSTSIPKDIKDDTREWFEKIKGEVNSLPRDKRLPLFEMALPELRVLSSGEKESLRRNVATLIESDGQISLFEFLLSQLLGFYLDKVDMPSVTRVEISENQRSRDISTIFSFVSLQTEGEPKDSFDAGVKAFGSVVGIDLKLIEDLSLEKVSDALKNISAYPLGIKEKAFKGAIAAIQHDGKVSPDERDLGRVLGLLWEIPVAPL